MRVAFLVLVLLAGLCRGQLVPAGYVAVSNVAYVTGATGDQVLDVYYNPTNVPPPPLIVFVHGGGWSTGNKDVALALRLFAYGARYQIASINYTLTTNAPHPAQIRDVKSAIRWLRANAATYNFDPERIGLWGGSAGAHLSCLAGTSGGVTNFGGTGNSNVSDRVQAVFAVSPPTDLSLYLFSTNGSDLSRFLGANVQANPPTLTNSNPCAYVSPDDPPFCFIHATNDTLVAPEHSRVLHAALTNAGVPSAANFFGPLGHAPVNRDLDHIALNFFSSAFGLDPDGLRTSVLVSCFNNHQVLEFNAANGQLTRVLVQGWYPPGAHGGLNQPHQPRLAADGSLLVADANNDRVLRYDGRSGALLGVFATNALLDYPVDIVPGPEGALYVSSQLNDRVLRFDATNGAFLGVFVTNDAAVLDGPSGLAFGPDGTLYAAGRFNGAIARYATNGVSLGQLVTGLAQPFGLRFGPDGQLYVAVGNNNEVRRYNPTNGALVGVFATTGLSLPVGLEFAAGGRLLVGSYANDTVQQYTPGGVSLGAFANPTNLIQSGPNFLTFRAPAGTVRPVTTAVALAEAATTVTGTLAAVRVGGALGALTVPAVTFSGSASNGIDFAAGTPFSWSSGQAGTQTVGVTVFADALAEGSETALVRLAGTTSWVALAIADRPFDAWRFTNFGGQANAPAAQPQGDFDGDGWANLFEYALGLQPTNADGAAVFAPALSGSGPRYLTATVARDPGAVDVALGAESAATIGAWTNTIVVLTNTPAVFSVRDAVPVDAAPQRFLRLNATR